MSTGRTHPELQNLNTSQIVRIRNEHRRGKTQRQLAIKYGVKERTIRAATAAIAVNNGGAS